MIVSLFFNGQMLPADKALIGMNELGLLRSYAVFDFCRATGGKPFLLPQYITRFRQSAQLMALELTYSDDEITDIVYQLLKRSGLQNAGIRFLLTGGYTPDGFTPSQSNFLIFIEALPEISTEWIQKGIKLMSYEYQRDIPEIKTTNYSTALRLQAEQQKRGAQDIVYYFNGNLLELTRNNFFLVKDNKVITPATGILKGITRQTVLDLAQQQYKVEVREVKYRELQDADEAFSTGTNKRIVPVVQIDDQIIGDGKVGVVTRNLLESFIEFES